MDIVTIFCDIDDFCQSLLAREHPQLPAHSGSKKRRASSLSLSEVMTILVWFHASHYRTFKHYYLDSVLSGKRAEFPGLPSYTRFVELIPLTLLPLCAYLQTRKGQPTGIQFMDSLPIRVCHNRRIPSHKVFAGLAQRGKGSMGWFYGFKLHLIINERGEVLGLTLTPGNTDDRRPVVKLVRQLWGKLFGDRGYIGQELFEQLWTGGLQLITKLKRNMKNKLMPVLDKLLLRKRALIECVNDQLKNISQIEHTRHRSAANGIINMLAAVAAYTFQPKKPALDLSTTTESQAQRLLLAAVTI
ncbi:MAG TPA: IS982 family transposase [Candidatus Acidoferrum sp.]|nr:IS982 family transposase [Candidatus Acidoferrum sp.]